MRMRSRAFGRLLVTLALSAPFGGCSVKEGGAGADCVRSTECQMGLVCIEGMCSADLSLIADPGEVPELVPDAGMEMTPADGGDVGMQMMPPADASDMGMDMTTEPDAATMLPADGG